jgi:hypothetical protein
VSQGQIRGGMSPNAVYLAWGSPDRKIVGNMRGRPTETWIYVHYTTYSYPYPYPYYGFGYGFGLTTVGVAGRHHRHHGRSFVFFGSPSTIHSFILTYRQVFRIPIRSSLSPMEGLYLSRSWCRRIPDQKFCRVRIKNASV